MENVPFHAIDCFDDPSTTLWAFNSLFTSVLDIHAPLKTKTIRGNEPPFMNSSLRKAVRRKKQLLNRFKARRSNTNWEAYRSQRNLTTKIRRNSIKNYFIERCAQGPKHKDFWRTIKPFLSNKT